MNSRAQSQVVYAAGLVQGIVLVTFPAASTIFTAPGPYGLSSSQYGAMFLPQAVTAVGSSLLQGNLSRRLGGKPVYLAGLCANLAAMILLIASRFVEGSQPAAYPLLLVATGCLGVGFGLTVPSINTFTAAFHPDAVDRSVLVLNSLLGLGTALAPVFVAIFVGLGFWVGLPVLAAAAVIALLAGQPAAAAEASPGRPARGAAARRGPGPDPGRVLAVRGLRGDVRVLRDHERELVAARPDLAEGFRDRGLTGPHRVLGHGDGRPAAVRAGPALVPEPARLPPAAVRAGRGVRGDLGTAAAGPGGGVAAFALAGFGCSALLPLTISFGQERLASMSAAMAGLVIAFYQLGYGIAAFGVGPLRRAGLTLPDLYGVSAVVAVALGLLSLAVAHGRPSPRSVHPRPQPVETTRPRK